MAAVYTNGLNLFNLTTKTSPTTSDYIPIGDAAVTGIPLKQATINSLPNPPVGGFLIGGSIAAFMPGVLSGISSDTQTQSINTILNSYVITFPFFVANTYTTTTMGTYVITGAAASTVTVGIYADSIYSAAGYTTHGPNGAALGAVSLTTTTNNAAATGSLALTLNSKTIYWAAIQSSTATTLALQAVLMNICCNNASSYVSGIGLSPQLVGFSNSYSAGSLPSLTNSSVVGLANAYAPIIYFY